MDIGNKIKEIRVKNDLTQEELADRCEITKGYISQIERNITSPSIQTLIDILEALGTGLKDFFSDNKEEKIVFTKEDVFVKEDEGLNHKITWIIPNAQKNIMEPIIMEINSKGRTYDLDPHEGEEFGYVLSGAIVLEIGDEKHKVKKGESFYFMPNSNHFISNPYKNKAKLIWVSTPPVF
ncbi:MAG: helix-turn-helix domain-containing protein [Clostridium sp.]|nr:helix-turn-helix domain-containing protein [Clostridium sp.]